MALQGVNLGGWLVLEKWMTPGLFADTDAVDEYTFLQYPGARARLRKHHNTFIGEEDWQWMSKSGINLVRIPVGYWILDGDGPYISAVKRLDWAFRMAAKYQIGILLCLHGAPGSQNGQDHSGRVGKANWYRSAIYRQQTIDILCRLADRYGNKAALWGLELLNEPRVGIIQWKLRRFYNHAYRVLADILPPHVNIVFHDAFSPRMLSGAIWNSKHQPVVMDIHWYHGFFPLHRWVSPAWYYRLVLPTHRRLLIRLKRWQGVIVGEWSGVLSGELLRKYPESEHAAIVAEHIARQLKVYERADAWFYWSYKTQERGVWHFRSMVEDGYLPLGES
jgi:glucan 1,3-beta-glucosidase